MLLFSSAIALNIAFYRSEIGGDRWNELFLEVDKLDTPEEETTSISVLQCHDLEHAIPTVKKQEVCKCHLYYVIYRVV